MRGYVDAHREMLALVVVRNGRIEQAHRPNDFPWIEPRIGGPVPFDSIVHAHKLLPGEITELEECDPETWLGASAARKIEVLSEQVLGQTNGWAMNLLHAEPAEGADRPPLTCGGQRNRFTLMPASHSLMPNFCSLLG